LQCDPPLYRCDRRCRGAAGSPHPFALPDRAPILLANQRRDASRAVAQKPVRREWMTSTMRPSAIFFVAAIMLAGSLSACVGTAPRVADTTKKMTTELVGSVLDELGLDYAERINDDGSPYLELVLPANLPGEQAIVFFHECAPGGTCEDIRLWSWYDTTPSLDVLNQWNADGRWTKAYLDLDRDAVLEMDINATGGIGTEALAILINTYFMRMQDFAAHIGYG
jgi:hypothetical protein